MLSYQRRESPAILVKNQRKYNFYYKYDLCPDFFFLAPPQLPQ